MDISMATEFALFLLSYVHLCCPSRHKQQSSILELTPEMHGKECLQSQRQTEIRITGPCWTARLDQLMSCKTIGTLSEAGGEHP